MRLVAVLTVAVACAAALTAASQPAVTSGLDLASLDRTIRPQDDLYRFANGGWLARTDIPSDRVAFGAFIELADKAESDIRAIIEGAAAAADARRGSTAQQIGDLYASMMNEARIEELGIAPIRPELDKIDAIENPTDLAAEAGYLSSIAGGGPFTGFVAEDARDPGQLVVHLGQGGMLLPDRDYYLGDDARFVEIRRQYEEYLLACSRWPAGGHPRRMRRRCSAWRPSWHARSGLRPTAGIRRKPTTASRCRSCRR